MSTSPMSQIIHTYEQLFVYKFFFGTEKLLPSDSYPHCSAHATMLKHLWSALSHLRLGCTRLEGGRDRRTGHVRGYSRHLQARGRQGIDP